MSGLPKSHKPEIPIIPVVDTTNSPAYQLSKYMNEIWNNLIDWINNKVKTSFDFKNFAKDVKIPRVHETIIARCCFLLHERRCEACS